MLESEKQITVAEVDGKWFVVRGDENLSGPFKENEEAWREADKRSKDGREDADTRRRIQTAFA